jgi:Ca-activated chloride channel family protein
MYLTDMQVNSGNSDSDSLAKLTQTNAANGIYTTYLGIGTEFDTAMVSKISKTKACNYFSVKNPQQFKKLMDDEFDFTVTPTLFDTTVNFVGEQLSGFEAQRVYGSPGFEIPLNGTLFFADSMFPSHKESEEKTKGGVVLVKLNKKLDSQDSAKILKFLVTYQDMSGKIEKDEDIVDITALTEESSNDYFQNNCVRKAVLLVRYVNFMKNFLRDIRTKASVPSMNQNTGIIIPSIEGESKSSAEIMTPLSDPYAATFKKFISYFEHEMTEIGDPLLNTELKKLIAILEYK